MSEFHVRETSNVNVQKTSPKTLDVPFFYAASEDGIDENLLILLHGLGDTHIPFSKLGKSLNLPQTAVLSLRAPEQVPFLEEKAFQWYTSFDVLGDLLDRPNPTSAVELLLKVVIRLVEQHGWSAHQIHLFGFGQGGSLAVEFGLKWWKGLQIQPAESTQTAIGSIITISGPLLSYPTLNSLCPTPLLVVDRPAPSETAMPAGSMAAFRKGYQSLVEVKLDGQRAGMPSSKEEWQPIMAFWSEKLGRRQDSGLYEVLTGSI
ncbi:hypothetical protein C8J56DRAFT_926154 [Mycena floridula]|nr:hypothetical protein C8J56DRAFT_926154 [Mycena floridula]